MTKRILGIVAAVVVLLAAAALAWWGWSVCCAAPAVPRTAPTPPPPEVSVVALQPAPVELPYVYAGRVSGFREVEIRPRVGGVVMKREYEEGARVAKGEVLFRIDPRPYQATLDRVNAQLAQAQASLVQATDNFARVEQLVRTRVATEKQMEDARAARDQAQATVLAAQAEITTAKLDLEFTTVTAPVAGRTALTSPPEGALAQAQQTVLTTITQTDPAYVIFAVTDAEYRDFQRMNRERKTPLRAEDLKAELRFADGALYQHPGRIDASSPTVDQRTGTILVRTIFPNAENGLLPGQFVRISMRGVIVPDALVVPERAVSQGPQGAFVYVLDANNVAQVRPVQLDRELAGGWMVRAGLQAGERIVVDGVIRVRPGMPVRPAAAPAAAGATPPATPQQGQTPPSTPKGEAPAGQQGGARQ
jgi:membrane fusion protein (multidrug efflux system)